MEMAEAEAEAGGKEVMVRRPSRSREAIRLGDRTEKRLGQRKRKLSPNAFRPHHMYSKLILHARYDTSTDEH